MGWRSQEQSHALKKRLGDKPSKKGITQDDKYKKDYSNYVIPEDLPDRFYDENGDINLSKVKAADARRFMEAQGIVFPPGVSRILESAGNDDVSQQLRKAYGNKGE